MSKLLQDVSAWLGNVSTSVAIVFVNKVLMAWSGYGFIYATTLCALHFLVCSASIWVYQTCCGAKRVVLPAADLIFFTVVANTSIVSLNLSLMLNPVSFYQIAKLLIIPFVCLVEYLWLHQTFSSAKILSMATVVCGVAIVTITGTHANGNTGGIAVAALSVLTSGMQQILCRTMQQKHGLSSHELLANTAPAQGLTLLLIGPLLDRFVSNSWIFNYQWVAPAVIVLAISCACAVLVNVTQFACLGRFSAVSFQVLGHSKTILVLLGGWAFLGDTVSARQLFGMVTAVAGMVAYGASSIVVRASPQHAKTDPRLQTEPAYPPLATKELPDIPHATLSQSGKPSEAKTGLGAI